MDPQTSRSSAFDRVVLAGDAFLFAAALDLGVTTAILGTLVFMGFDAVSLESALGPVIGAFASPVLTLVLVLGGAIVAWRLHAYPMDRRAWTGMALGLLLGVPAMLAVIVISIQIGIRVTGSPDRPPWALIAVFAAAALALAFSPIVDAARDAAPERRAHLRLDWLRVGALGLTAVCALVIIPILAGTLGPEVAEAGVFMVPFAAGAALAVTGADFLRRRHDRSAGSSAGATSA